MTRDMIADPISVDEVLAQLEFLPNRRPDSPSSEVGKAFSELSSYRDGSIFVGHYAGNSCWERHPAGDEIVYVLEGETTLFILDQNEDVPHVLKAGQMLVVPQNTWHRFETKTEVKVLTVTPQPEEHSLERPVD